RRKSSPRTMSVGWRRGEFGHLLADETHLFAIIGVGRQAPDLFLDRRADSPSRRCLSQGCADGF
ncbi:MAG TPA: hypothetical protein VG410_00320, partial [Solirubrobacteraceae bacterium]|nr:hypothetical protein [Solirubrobacteraceae bacterium]